MISRLRFSDHFTTLIANIPGRLLADGNVPVYSGWNLLGPVGAGNTTDLPNPNEGVIGTIWYWDAALGRFSVTKNLSEGSGYWIWMDSQHTQLNLGL